MIGIKLPTKPKPRQNFNIKSNLIHISYNTSQDNVIPYIPN